MANPHPNPCPDWATDRSWAEIVRASTTLTTITQFYQRKLFTIPMIFLCNFGIKNYFFKV